jgi:hypothetical protein
VNIIQREYETLRDQRVRLRKAIEQYGRRAVYEDYNRYGADGHLNTIASLRVQLRGTERRWQELHLLLGKRLPGPPVKLAVTPRSQPVRRQAVTRSAPVGYMTKVMRPA